MMEANTRAPKKMATKMSKALAEANTRMSKAMAITCASSSASTTSASLITFNDKLGTMFFRNEKSLKDLISTQS